MSTKDIGHELSSGNVFADLGLPGAEELLAIRDDTDERVQSALDEMMRGVKWSGG